MNELNFEPPSSRTEKPARKDRDGLHKRRGIWHYKLRIAGRWREISAKTRNYQEAKRAFAKAVKDQGEGKLAVDMARAPIRKIAQAWSATRRNVVAAKTIRTEEERLKPLLAVLGDVIACDLSSDQIRQFQQSRLADVGPRTVNLETKVLRMMLRYAKQWGRLADDYKPLRENKRGPGRALTEEQEAALFASAQSRPEWETAFLAGMVAANTGLRNKEVRTLRLGDIDLEARTLTVQRQNTKTDAGCRLVPLNEQAVWSICRLLDRARLHEATTSEHFVFPAYRYRRTREPNMAGSGFDPAAPMKGWRTAWRSLTKNAGLPGLRFHDLRHGFITRHLEAGTPDHVLMSLVGHVSREMLEHYSHTRLKAKHEAVSRVQTAVLIEPVPSTVVQ